MKGTVQGVGYRALVKQIARRRGIKGKVKNLSDGSVELYCEGDKNSILGFIEAIDIRSKDADNVFAVDVERIEVFWEEEEGYVPIKEEFRSFEIDYGEEAETVIEKANLERLEIGSLIMLDIGQKMAEVGTTVSDVGVDVRDVGAKVSDVGAEVKGVQAEVRGVRTEVKDVRAEVRGVRTEVKEGFSATHGDFEELDGKYDVVSKELKSINKNISKLVDHLGTIIEQFTENKKKKNSE